MKELYIEQLYMKKFRKFKEARIKFNKGFNFLVGANGNGKTSILRALALNTNTDSVGDSRVGEDSEFHTIFTYNEKRYKIGLGKGWVNPNSLGYRTTSIMSLPAPEREEGIISLSTGRINEEVPVYAPLFISAYRKVEYTRIEGMRREDVASVQRQKYRNNAAKNINGSLLPNSKQWLINRYFIIEKDWGYIEKENWNWLISNLNKMSPKNMTFKFKDIGKDLEPRFDLNGQITYFEELSAGYHSILSIIFSIFEWVEAINEGNERLVKNAKGTVVIDELDVHLHPQWQLTITDSLRAMFPSIQFIVTTHSPHIIATAKEGEIIKIPSSEMFSVSASDKNYQGWTTDQILEDIMEVSNLNESYLDELIEKASEFFNNKELEKFNHIYKEIKKITHPNDPITSQFQIMLARLNLMENEIE